MQWYADYCGVTVGHLESLGVCTTSDGWLAHSWPGVAVTKDRKPGTGDRRWSVKGSARPKLWPLVPDELPETVWLCEGETDCIVLRAAGLEHVYTAGSASEPLSRGDMEQLKARGVEHVVIAYDSDRAGQEGARKAIEAAREAGLFASVASLGDPLTGQYKDWRERWLAGEHEPPRASMSTRLDVWRLDEIEEAEDVAMLADHIHPTDHTILFGDGGTGKGAIAAQLVADLTSHPDRPLRVLILDYEAHARHEWRKRVARFGGAMTRVFVIQPTQPVWDIAQDVREIIESEAIDLVVIDSITYACVGEEVEKSATAAKYTVAISHFKRPVLSLAHTTKTDLGAKHPFGSIFWSNGARVTINVRVDGSNYNDPRVVECKKTNQQAPFAPYQIDWSWVDTDLPPSLWEERSAFKVTWQKALVLVLTAEPNGLPLAELSQAMESAGAKLPASLGVRLSELVSGKREPRLVKDGDRYKLPTLVAPRKRGQE